MNQELPRRNAIRVFAIFAFVYFLSTLSRAVTATLAPELTEAFDLSAASLGLLAGGYFVGLALMQIPLGHCLDRFGPPRVAATFLVVAIGGSVLLALAQSFWMALAGRVLLGVGLAAGLMAPLTAYRQWFAPAVQVRANAWMLMIGSLGMLVSTVPTQRLVEWQGWRTVFWIWAVLAVLALLGLLLKLPRWVVPARPARSASPRASAPEAPAQVPQQAGDMSGQPALGVGQIVRDRRFRSVVPLGFFSYGGMFAILTLWVGPWMTNVAGLDAEGSASGLLWINAAMMLAFLFIGLIGTQLARRGMTLESLVLWGTPASLLILPVVIGLGAHAGWPHWMLYCLSITPFSMLQPKLAQCFAPEVAGRVLTAFNLAVFTGTFVMQWAIGGAIDAFRLAGFGQVQAYQSAMLAFWAFNLAAYGWFLRTRVRQAAP
ncbi:MFS transporter [Corticibacter populi]|uniref:MFS transporter n=1 Tax=Corticibacter populi TaxID=1550736 RepID=UPI0010E2FC6F|nr:MFS transporter [Corticibacter populi]RZS35601.1 putative MFS family arabinose efflux permease [Corticibacter populi]